MMTLDANRFWISVVVGWLTGQQLERNIFREPKTRAISRIVPPPLDSDSLDRVPYRIFLGRQSISVCLLREL